jgi:hypothetical protein
MQSRHIVWSVAVFTARESIQTLTECVNAAIAACLGREAVIDILVNGNEALAHEAAQLVTALDAPEGIIVRAWFIRLGDKAHTWNLYLGQIWQGTGLAFFVDGYANVRGDAFLLIDQALAASPDALGATGVPTSGRTAKALRHHLLTEGGIHGNLYAISIEGMLMLLANQFKLPLGLYRTDPLVAAVLMFRCDPKKFGWNSKIIVVHPEATWDVRQSSPWTVANLLVALKRKLRQAQGVLENRAAREHLAIRKRAPSAISRTAAEFVRQWVEENPQAACLLFLRNPLSYFANKKLAAPRDWAMAEEAPVLAAVTEPANHRAGQRIAPLTES